MEDQYGIGDLRQYMNGRPLFTSIQPPTPDLLARNLGPAAHYEMVMGMAQVPSPHGVLPHHQHHEFLPDSTTAAAATNSVTGGGTSSAGFSGLENMDAGGGGSGLCGDAGSGRWPRQETLTLLEIRSRLDSKFKEANQKGPLWDEVSRILSEEHGYQRTGKKCREKFENLYKYYKKTKEGKAGRQDGKHYRYFRQLEALYGITSNRSSISETNNDTRNNQEAHLYQDSTKLSDSLINLSNSSDFDSTSFDDSEFNIVMDKDSKEKRKKKKRGKRSWKAKIRDFIDGQMTKLMEKQEAWLEKMMKTIEHKEQERILREEEWRKQEAIRIEKQQKIWATERAWIEARDAALIEALHKLTGEELKSNKNASSMCKENWDGVNSNATKRNKKQRNSSFSSCYNFQNNEQGRLYCETSSHVPNVQTVDDGLF